MLLAGVPLAKVHEYVAPETLGVKATALPVTGEEGLKVKAEEGFAFTVTVVVPAEEAHPATVAVTLYVPLSAAVTLAIEGFCCEEVNPFGPVQL